MRLKVQKMVSITLVCVFVFLQNSIYIAYADVYQQNTVIGNESYEQADVAIIHFNPQINEKNENIARLKELIENAFNSGAEIVLAPELSTTGYLISKEDVLNGQGITNPIYELKEIADLAKRYDGYVCMGYAEVTEGGHTYNSAILFGPEGVEINQRKRTLPGWNERGNNELTTIETKYGNVGVIICADSYSPDYTRILALKGADIILLPCTWWGDEGQLSTWKSRARENGVWMIIGNRWGNEYDSYYDYNVDMNDAPSAIISPYGNVELAYTKYSDNDSSDKILLHRISVDEKREVYSLIHRNPSSYIAIANEFYRPTLGNLSVPGLPESGEYKSVALSYIPKDSATQNLNKIKQLLRKEQDEIDLVTLPAYGLTKRAIRTENLLKTKCVQELQNIVEHWNIDLLVTQINIKEKNETAYGMLIMQKRELPIVVRQIHDEKSKNKIVLGSHEEPFYLDIEKARVGIITGNDYMFPETITSLAKNGVDIVLISSDIIDNEKSVSDYNYVSSSYMKDSISTLISHCIHIAISDNSGYSEIIESQWGIAKAIAIKDKGDDLAKMTLDTSLTRNKYLQEYLLTDIETLISIDYMIEKNVA